jgi:O-antigen ligase
MKSSFFIRKDRLFFFFALAITVGTPNLDEFDTTGITRGIEAFGIVAPTFLWRIIVFILVGATAGLILAYNASTNAKLPRARQFGLCWLLYLWLAISSIITFSTFFDLALSIYRLLEWGIALLVTLMLFSTSQKKAINIFSHYLRLAPLLALGLLGMIWLYNPSLTYSFSPTKEAFRLGGIAMPPNSIGLLFGLGALYWCVTGRHNKLWTLITLVLFLACLLTWSRSGIGGTCFAAIIYLALRKFSLKKLSHATVFIIILTVLPIIIFLYHEAFIVYFLRGEDIDYILSAAGRLDVWRGVFELFKESPFFGHGFIFGPKLLMFSPLIPAHWSAAHAHNDILNMSIAGGIIGVIILILIYYEILKKCYRIISTEPLLISTFCGIFVSNIFETGLSTSFGIRGFLMIALLRIVTVKSTNPPIK